MVGNVVKNYKGHSCDLIYNSQENLKVAAIRVNLRQALVYLMNNALEAVEGVKEPRIEVSVSDSKGFVEISIQDNGSGVPQDIRHRIFEPFYTTKSRQNGLGMGLSLAKTLIHSMGAKLYLDSKHSSRFVIEMHPVAKPKSIAA